MEGITKSQVFTAPEIGAEEEAALARIHDLRDDLRIYLAEPQRWVGGVARLLRAQAVRGSNSIEGFNVSAEDALAVVKRESPPESEVADEAWKAVSGYQQAMTYCLQLAEDPHFRYTPELIRSLHFMMTSYDLAGSSPGRWRPGPIWVRNDATGEVVYEGPEAEAVPDLIEALVAQLAEDDDGHPMVRGAMAHLNLAMVHPFRDGNGRMARCLQTLVLVREAILAPEWCSIEEYLGRNTADYYRVLAEVGEGQWNPGNDALPWVRFCLKAHYIQAASVLRRVRESEEIYRAVDEIRQASFLHERTMPSLFDAALGFRIRNASYRSNAEVFDGNEISQQTATNDLKTLVSDNLLEKRGEKRGTHYVAAPALRTIVEEVRKNRGPISADDLFVV